MQSIYARLGDIDTVNLIAMFDAVIAREEAAARHDAGCPNTD